MDIFFCDECSARLTDLDLRAGRGMRRRHDSICVDCVDRGLAKVWLGRVGATPAAAVQQFNGPAAAAAAVAVAEPDPISVARDRARTQLDDPFAVEEPAAIPTRAKTAPDTESLAVSPRKPQPSTEEVQPIDGLAAAAGSFGALVGSSMALPPKGLVDEPVEPADADEAGVQHGVQAAPAESPFDFVAPTDYDNPGKAETAEVEVVDGQAPPKPAKSGSGRQTSQKRSATSSSQAVSSSRRTPKPSSTRRASRQGSNKKIMLLSLVSCAVMVFIFFGFVLPNVNKARKPAEVIRDEPLVNLKSTIDAARTAGGAGMTSDDLATVERGIAAIRAMQSAFNDFQRKAGSKWDDNAHGEQLRVMGYYDVMTILKALNDRKGIIERRQ